MFEAGYILSIKNFQFNDGGKPKDKYFIVLKIHDGNIVLGCLPTRTNNAPGLVDVEHGCVNKDDRCFNCYVFKRYQKICDNGFCFDMLTFVYGDQIDSYDLATLKASYPTNSDLVVDGKLLDDEFKALIDCLINSASTKKKFVRILKQ